MFSHSATPRLRVLRLIAELRRRHVFRVAVVYAITAFAALQGAQLLAEGLELPAWVFRAITLVTVLGFPVALVLAWALELTPSGIRRTRSIQPDADLVDAPPPATRWRAAVFSALALVLLAGGVWMTARQPAVRYDSIAVLPFVDLSAETDSAYLGDALAEELISALGNVTALKVAARTSAFSFRARDIDVREIGRTLGVATVLEGSVRRSADQVRIVAQLVDASTGFRIWGGEYEADTEDLFILQNRLAGEIVERLAVELGAVDPNRLRRSGTLNPLAYELYLRARQRWAGRQVPELRTAFDEMSEAVRLDPEFALAWAGLSDVIVALARRDQEARTLHPRARTAALRALTIAPDLPEAWASVGAVASDSDVDWETAERALRRAVAMRPSFAQAHQWLGDVQRYLGQFDRAAASYERAVVLDPLSPVFRRVQAAHLARFGDAEKALALFRQLLSESPGDDEVLAHLASTRSLPLTTEERAQFAVEWASAVGFSAPEQAALMVRANEQPELLADALAVVTRIEAELGPAAVLYDFCAALGDREHLFAMLERGVATLEPALFGLSTDPVFGFLAGDPRFSDIIRRQHQTSHETGAWTE